MRRSYYVKLTGFVLIYRGLITHCLLSIDRTVEITSCVFQALILFKELYPGYRKVEIEKCIENASKFIEDKQREDGSWSLNYNVCYVLSVTKF